MDRTLGRRCLLTLLLTFPLGMALHAPPCAADTRNVVVQSQPTDCGPAALATLLRFYLETPVDEKEILKLADYKPESGTTLLGLERAARSKRCEAGSFRMSYPVLREQLKAYPTPVIVRLLNPEPHFVVLLAIENRTVFLADPANGNVTMGRDAFLKRWYAPGDAEGFVFIAARPDRRQDQKRCEETVASLKQGLRNLAAAPPPRVLGPGH
ncbi:MAG: hypothetical protein H7Z41_17745 [Cytophagales bacterium]|nr:hypothetical protein [Armatimonadota bacterium]